MLFRSVNALPSSANNFAPMVLPAYIIANASVTARMYDHWSVALIATNLLGKRAILAGPPREVPLLGALANTYGINRPREITLRVGYNW